MKRIPTFLISILLPCSLFAQSPALIYMKNLSGNKHEYPGTACPSFDGGVILGIGSTSTTGNINLSCNPTDSRNIFQKYNSSGKLEWEKCIIPTADSAFAHMYEMSTGDLILGGANNNLNGPKGRNFRIRRQKSNLDIVWSKELGGSAGDNFKAMAATADGAYVLFGHSNSDDGDVGFHYGPAGLFDYDLWAIKVDTSGKVLWSKVIGGTGNEKAEDICPATDSGCYIVGQTTSTDYDCAGPHNPNYIFGYVARLDKDGKILWYRKFGSDHGGMPLSCAPNGKGGVVIVAQSDTGGGDVTKHLGGWYDYWVINIDSTNKILWDKNYGGPSHELPSSICLGKDNTFWVTGNVSAKGGDVETSYGQGDNWIINIDTDGKLLKSKVLGGPGTDKGTIIHPLDGGMILAAGTYTAAGPVGGEFPTQYLGDPYDAFITLLAPWTTDIEAISTSDKKIAAYPNPASDLLRLENSTQKTIPIKVYNHIGQKVAELPLKSGITSLDISAWSSGRYFILWDDDTLPQQTVSILIQ